MNTTAVNSTDNGTATNGTDMNGTDMNGTALNGTSDNGTALNGTSDNGTATGVGAGTGTGLNDTGMNASLPATLNQTLPVNNTICFASCFPWLQSCYGDANCNAQLLSLLQCSQDDCGVFLGSESNGSTIGINEDVDTFNFSRAVYSRECYPANPAVFLQNFTQCVESACIFDQWTWDAAQSAFTSNLNSTILSIPDINAEFSKLNITAANFSDIAASDDTSNSSTTIPVPDTNITAVNLTTVTFQAPANWSDYAEVKRDVLGDLLGSYFWNWDGEMWDFENGTAASNTTTGGAAAAPELDCGSSCAQYAQNCLSDENCISDMAYMVGCAFIKCEIQVAIQIGEQLYGSCTNGIDACETAASGVQLQNLANMADLTQCFSNVCYPSGNNTIVYSFVSCLNDNCEGGLTMIGGAGVLQLSLMAALAVIALALF